MSDIHLSGFLFNASGAALESATVEAFPKNTVTETGGTASASTTTNSAGYYTLTVTSDNEYDVRITSGNSVRWRRFDDRVQMEELEVSVLNIREGATAQVYTIAPGSISADRTLTLPAATGDDTLASLGMAQTFSANQAFTGTVTVGTDGSGTDVIFYSGTAGDNLTWDASEELLTITGTNGTTALNVADGNVTIADNLTVSGNLTVTGTTTSVDSTTINAATAFVFEGATANCYETTLAITDPTADRTIYLPNQSGYLPVLASASTTQVGSTPEELNFLDGSAKSTSSITICDADAFIVIDGTTTKQIPASDITTYVGAGTMSSFQLEDDDGTEVAISNAKEVKIIGSGVTTNWTDTDNGTDGDPYDLTITVDAAQTGITSVYNASLKVGRDSGNLIDFATTDNKLIFRVECVNEVELVQNALSPVTSDGVALGTSSLMWSDAFLASGSVINFNNGDVTLTHSACTLTVAGGTLAAGAISTTGALTVGVDDTGHDVKFFGAAAGAYMLYDQSCDQLEIRGASADATTSTGKLLLSTSLTNVNANDVIGSINFQAPAEAGGTDAIAIAAGIRAVAQATFTCAVNSTDLIFYTGHSEAATEKFRFTSQGEIGIGGANYGTDGQVLTSGGAGAAAAWEDAGGGAVSAINNATANELVTIGATTTELCAEANLTFDGTGQFAFVNSATCSSSDFKVESSATSGATPARLILRTGQGNTADTYMSFHGVCTYEYSIGVDNSDSDKFKISGAALGTNDKFIIDPIGAITMPLQPSVLAYNSGDDDNVTGDNTAFTGIYNSEVWDLNGDWDGTSTFTAPVTGKYLISVNTYFSGITSSINSGDMRFDASNRNSANIVVSPYGAGAGGTGIGWSATNTLDMDTNDTLTIRLILRGGAQVADFEGNADLRNSISISLLH